MRPDAPPSPKAGSGSGMGETSSAVLGDRCWHRDANRDAVGCDGVYPNALWPVHEGGAVSLTMPCLETEYAGPEALPRNPASELTFTMAPRPAASIVGSTARASLNEPVRLILGINHALGQLAPTQRDQPLQRQVSYGSERALAEPGPFPTASE
jgi:hypothetical protein